MRYLSQDKPTAYLAPRIQTFSASGLFTVPDEVYSLDVLAVAPGGNGLRVSASALYGGGSGGWFECAINVWPGDVLDVIVGETTGLFIADGATLIPLRTCRSGGNAIGDPNFGAGAGGFPNGSGGGKNAANGQAGGCAFIAHIGTVANPNKAGGGYMHGSRFHGNGRYGGGANGTGGCTPYPWGAGGHGLSTATNVINGGPGQVILTWMQPTLRTQ